MYVDVHGRDRAASANFERSTSPVMTTHGHGSRRVLVDNPRQPHFIDPVDVPYSVGRHADVAGGPLTTSLRGVRGADSMDYQHPTRQVAIPPVSLAVNASSGGRRVRPSTLDERFRAIALIREEQERRKKEQQEEDRQRKVQQQKQVNAATEARLAESVQRQREARLANVEARRRSWQTNGQDASAVPVTRHGARERPPSSISAPAALKRDPPGSMTAGTRVNPPVRERVGAASAGKSSKGSVKDRIKIPVANRLTFVGDPNSAAAAAVAAPQAQHLPISARLSFGTSPGIPGQAFGGGSAPVPAPGVGPAKNTRAAAAKRNSAAFGAAVFGLGPSQGFPGAARQKGANLKAGRGGGTPTAKGGKATKKAPAAVTHSDLDEDLDNYWSKKDE